MNGYKIPLLLLALIGITRKSKHIQRFGIRNGSEIFYYRF